MKLYFFIKDNNLVLINNLSDLFKPKKLAETETQITETKQTTKKFTKLNSTNLLFTKKGIGNAERTIITQGIITFRRYSLSESFMSGLTMNIRIIYAATLTEKCTIKT